MSTTATYRKTYPISWDQLHRDSKALAWRLLDMDYFKGIIAITRGGLVPAAIIARELDIHLVDTICIASYDWKDKKGDTDILKKFDGNGEGWLLIDDLVDTGRTAKIVRQIVPKAHFATVYAKPAGRRPRSIPISPRSARTPGSSFPGTPNHSLSPRWRAKNGPENDRSRATHTAGRDLQNLRHGPGQPRCIPCHRTGQDPRSAWRKRGGKVDPYVDSRRSAATGQRGYLPHGRQVTLTSTDRAIKAGIGMVYQHFKLVDAMTVAENIFLGHQSGIWLNWTRMHRKVADLAEQYGMKVNPAARISDLSMGERQQVEILKLLHRRSTILIFDEPTAVLTPREAENLFATMKLMTAGGKGIVFISHKLEEVMAIADTIAILRRGEIFDTIATAEVGSAAELAERMVGREVLLKVDRIPQEPRQIVLKFHDLQDAVLSAVNLELRQGEILGLVGVAGNGQKQLVETICGLRKPAENRVRILGMEWRKFFRKAEWERTLSYIPEDRQGLATCQGLNLLDNFLLTTRGGFARGPWLMRELAEDKAARLVEEFDIRPPDLSAFAWQLSGGNLQKMVLAREFYRKPRLIVAEQPTQGLDIAATEDVWNLLLQAREAAGILLVTGDLSEALALSDRIGVMYNGRIVDLFSALDEEKVALIPQMMAGLFRQSG